jgi:cytochrome c biogenesis protein CcdA
LGRQSRGKVTWLGSGAKGLGLGVTVSAGFFTVFAVLGLASSFLGSVIGRYIPWTAAAVGGGLAVLGVLTLLGKAPSFALPLERASEAFTKRDSKEGFSFFYLFGIGYAVASVGCTLPIFMIVLTQAFVSGVLNGFIHFLAYALGMTLLMLALSLVVVYAKEVIYRYLNPLLSHVNKVSALVLIGAGIYLIYYNLFYSGVISF